MILLEDGSGVLSFYDYGSATSRDVTRDRKYPLPSSCPVVVVSRLPERVVRDIPVRVALVVKMASAVNLKESSAMELGPKHRRDCTNIPESTS